MQTTAYCDEHNLEFITENRCRECLKRANESERRISSELGGARGSAADVESEVCEDIKARQRRGIAKYGTTVAANPLTQTEWLQHAYEEALDLAIYLKKIIVGTKPPNATEMSHRLRKD